MLLLLPELTNLIINFSSTNLKIALNALQIENFQSHLLTKNTLYYTKTQKNILVRAKYETKKLQKLPKLTAFIYVITEFTIKLDI